MHSSTATTTAIANATPKEAYDRLVALELTKFYPRSGLLPAIVDVRDQDGAWGRLGQTHRLILSDGGHVIETITDTDSPTYFAYELTDFQKLFKVLVAYARAEWRFEREEHGTRVTWTYTYHGRSGRGWMVSAIVRLLWAPYMRRVLPPIAGQLGRAD